MAFPAYRSAAVGERLPAYARTSQHLLGDVSLDVLSTECLWEIHGTPPNGCDCGPSLLDLKIELASRMMRQCSFCERRCGADREAGETGFCGVGAQSRWFFEQVLWGEEAPLNPSHEIFFTGCNMRCSFCYSWKEIEHPATGNLAIPEELVEIIDRRRLEGALNVNLIGGEPTVNLSTILKTIKHIKQPTPVIWNSNFYMSVESMKLLDGVVDLYVGDFRFGNDQCARRIAATNKYFEIAARNFTLAAQNGEVIIRHLALPGHIECCLRPIAQWIAEHLPQAPFNLMLQYTPFLGSDDDTAPDRCLSSKEMDEARRIVSSLGLNAVEWNQPIGTAVGPDEIGSGEIETSVIILPDGRVVIQHLHGELLPIVRALGRGGFET